jgi:hypothetical protein
MDSPIGVLVVGTRSLGKPTASVLARASVSMRRKSGTIASTMSTIWRTSGRRSPVSA